MGQGPSSIDYNYVYKDKDKNNIQVIKKDINGIKQLNKTEIDSINSVFNELLNVLKYHTNMFAIDKNFVLKNKLISKELDDKTSHLRKEIKKNNDEYITLSESFRLDSLETNRYDRYNIALKYSNICCYPVFKNTF